MCFCHMVAGYLNLAILMTVMVILCLAYFNFQLRFYRG